MKKSPITEYSDKEDKLIEHTTSLSSEVHSLQDIVQF